MKKLMVVLLMLAVLVPVMCFAADAPAAAKKFKVLVLDSQESDPYKTVRLSMLEELKTLGFEEGKNLEIVYYSLGNYEGRGASIIDDEIKTKKNVFDIIFANGTIAGLACKKSLMDDANNKIIFANITDPIGVGLIEKFDAAPNHNFTGICFPVRVKERLTFIKKNIAGVKNIGFVYADMPQSQSYKKWLDDLLAGDADFKDLKIAYKSVEFVKGDQGNKRMVELAEAAIKELDATVDVFMSPNDQLGSSDDFAPMVAKTSTKPLVGLNGKDVLDKKGATIVIFPSLKKVGKEIAGMMKQMFDGKTIKDIFPKFPECESAVDLTKAAQFKLTIPEETLKTAGEKNVIK